MYCSQCGNEIIENARFCNNCGHPIPQKEESNSAGNQQAFLDAVEDIQQKLREIDNRKKDPIKKENVIKSAIKVAKKGVSAIDSVFNNSFEEKKLADKKQLILNYPLPSSPKALANFAKYINSVIVSKKREPDALTDAWKDKLKQIYLFAETKLSTSQEFMEIQKLYLLKKILK